MSLDLRVSLARDCPEHLDLLDHVEHLVTREPQENKDPREPTELLVFPDLLDLQESREISDPQPRTARTAHLDPLALRAPPDLLDPQDPLARTDHPAQLATQDRSEIQDQSATPDLLDPLDHLVSREPWELPPFPVLLVSLASRDQLELLELPVPLETPEQLVRLDPRVQLAVMVPRESLDPRETRVSPESPLLVLPVSKDPLALVVPLASAAALFPDLQDPLVFLDILVLAVLLALAAHRESVVSKDLLARREPLESPASAPKLKTP